MHLSMFASDLKDKKPKEQERRGDFLPRPFPKKLDKNLPAHRQPSASLVTQIQNTRALLRDRKATKSGFPDKGESAGCSPGHGCVLSCVALCPPSQWLCGPLGQTQFLCPQEAELVPLRHPGNNQGPDGVLSATCAGEG